MLEKISFVYRAIKWNVFKKRNERRAADGELAHFRMYVETATLDELISLNGRMSDIEAKEQL